MPAADFTQRVYECVSRIPHGTVTSYGAIAAMLGTPRAARGVGWALSALPEGTPVPWWRVINRNGEISLRTPPHKPVLQRTLLRSEGIRFSRAGRVDMKKFGWVPDDDV